MRALSLGKYASLVSRRSISTFSDSQLSKMSYEEWTQAFKGATHDLAAMDVDNISYADSSSRLRTLIQSRLLRHDDLYKHPERFFQAHRLIAEHAASLGPGFWVRFTVHYNLCVGTVLELGGPEHLQDISDMQEKGLLGCFGLTERLAGVSSGLIVQTTADWDPSSKTFVLNSPTPGAAKNWISQGFVADKVVVVADLKIKNKSFGPHAFFTDLRRNGEVVKGVKLVDMGRKTVGNDLDNARISFDNVVVPKSSLLNRFAEVSDDKYIQKVDGLPAFHMIGQRLFSGRVAVAQAALTFRKSLFARTKKHSDSKQCWFPKQTRPLSSFPHLAHLYQEDEKSTQKFETFLAKVENELSNCLKSKKLPSPQLVETIAAAKVLVVEDCISAVHQLQNEVGSFALMHGTGFEQRDFLTCCKFAEGDSRILMQKIARDRLRVFQKKQLGSSKDKWDEETKLCSKLHELIEKDPLEWDKNWREVDVLASLVMDRTVKEFMSK